jgi:hypothetical protein
MGTLGVRYESYRNEKDTPSRRCCLFNFVHFRPKKAQHS